ALRAGGSDRMSSRRLLLATSAAAVLFILATVSAFASAAQVTIKDVDSQAFPVVTMTVLVSGKAHTSDITAQENGVPVDSPAITQLGSSAGQIDVVLVLDTSASMLGAPLSSAIAAARDFIANAPTGVRIGLVTFSDKPVVAQRITLNHAAV